MAAAEISLSLKVFLDLFLFSSNTALTNFKLTSKGVKVLVKLQF